MHVVKRSSFFIVGALLFCVQLMSCGGGDEPTKVEKVTKLLTQEGGAWEPASGSGSITLEGEAVEDELFPGFAMQFTTEKIFTSGDAPYWDEVTGNNPLWLAEDTWTFKDANADVIIRGSDGKELKIIGSVTATELVLELEWDGEPTYGYGRAASLPGTYQFTLSKQ